MTLQTTKRPIKQKRRLTSVWRSAYTWRWNIPHPVAKNDQRWFIVAATTLKKIREDNTMSENQISNWITWFWTWYVPCNQMVSRVTVHPVALRFSLNDYLSWQQRFAEMLGTHTIRDIASHYYPHTSEFPGPWEIEDL